MEKLKKQIGAMEVFAVASGAMISSGLFVLPAIAYLKAGPALIVSYLVASILILPSLLSAAELSTAMPKAGGTYFYVERSLGPLWGLFGGLADWFSLALKSAFAVIGMAVLVDVIAKSAFNINLQTWHIKTIATACCLIFMILNIFSVKSTLRFQIFLVAVLLVILALFAGSCSTKIDLDNYRGFWDKGFLSVLAASGMVFVSFAGLTKVSAISEEVKDPGKNLPLGMLLAWFVVTIFYLTTVAVTVGVLTPADFDEMNRTGNLMPISIAAKKFMSTFGFIILNIAAVAAFLTTANGGILAASRSPLAMSRDRLLHRAFARINQKYKTPHISILFTCAFIIASIIFLDIEKLVKTASTLILILFILANASVIIMRESKIQTYRPKFRSPLYPYPHIFAIVIYAALIVDMGKVPLIISASFVILSTAWYFLYVSKRVTRASAAMHIVERVTDKAIITVTLENELRDILIERDNIIEDRFDKLIRNCVILDIKEKLSSEELFRQVASILSLKLDISEYVLFEKFLYREQQGGTVIQPGLAIPHVIVDGENKFEIILVRAVEGVEFTNVSDPVRIIFFLAGSKDERNYHLRALMAIAQTVQQKDFEKNWLNARDIETIRNLILLSARKRDI
ncbi:MAG: amino acid permease [Candidatus Brocadiia bacterium]|nr:MAG: amino acid permease [Candidatus Brocadiia bacterium]